MPKRKSKKQALKGGWTDYDIKYLIEDLLNGEDAGNALPDSILNQTDTKGATAGMILHINNGQKFKVIIKEIS